MGTVLHKERLVGGHGLLITCVAVVEAQLPTGDELIITDVGRSDAMEYQLWRKGREIPGEPPFDAAHPLGHAVTNATNAEESAHGYRQISPDSIAFCALDWYPLIDGSWVTYATASEDVQMRYDAAVVRWQAVARSVVGITLGVDFPLQDSKFRADPPHVEVAGWKQYPYVGHP